MKLNRWMMLCGCLVAACSLSAQNWTAGSSPLVAAGTTVTVNGTEPPLHSLTNNGTIAVVSGGSVSVTGTVGTAVAVGSGVGQSGALTLTGNGAFSKTGAGMVAIGYLGGSGTLDIGPGASFTSAATFCVPRNEADTRELTTASGTVTVSGSLTVPQVAFNAYFPTNAAILPPYGVPVTASLILNAGGVATVWQLNKNDISKSVILFNGGTLQASPSASTDFATGTGELDFIIADGQNAVFDSNGKDIRIASPAAPYAALVALRGEEGAGKTGNGGFVKTGAGTLTLKLIPACNTFTGAVQVLQGTLDLGRPLAEHQRVTVSAGANFVPHGAGDLPKITYLGAPGEKQLYTVAEDTDTLDLTAFSAMYDDARLGGPFSGTVTLSNALTHAAGGTAADPFRLIGQGGTLNLTNTGLETAFVQIEGPGTFNFQGTRSYTAADAGKLVITDGGYRQSPAFLLSDPNAATPAAFALTSGRFEVGTLLAVGTNGFGAFAVDGGTLTGGGILIGAETGSVGAFSQSTGTVTLAREVMVGADGGTGYLTVTGGSFIVNADLRIAGNLSGNRALRPQGSAVISNALARCNIFNFTPNWPSDGSGKTLEAGLLSLLPGGVLELNYLNKNDDPVSTVSFGGGRLRARQNHSAFISTSAQVNGTIRLVAEAGADITIDTQGFEVAAVKPSGTSVFTGAGGFRKLGAGTLIFSGTRVDYAGDTTIEAGTLRLADHHQIPQGAGKGDVVFGAKTVLDLNGKNESVNRLIGAGRVLNANAAATLGVLADGSDSTWDRTWLSENILLEKLGAGTLTLASHQAAPTNLTVAAGTVRVAPAVGYSSYRFKIEGIKDSGANAMQLSEIALYDGDVNVTQNRISIAYDSTGGIGNTAGVNAFPAAETPEKAVDGVMLIGTTTSNKWLDFRAQTTRSPEDRDRVWLQINFAGSQRVTRYNWATGNDTAGRDPAAWRLQGSFDGATWVDLDVKTGYAATATRNAWVETDGFPVSSVNTGASILSGTGAVQLQNGASLVLDGISQTIGTLSGRGSIALANANLTLVPPAGAETFFVGPVSGNGGLIHAGEGKTVLGGDSTYTGDTLVQSGTLEWIAGTPFKWFRFTVTENGGTNVTQFSEFALYGPDGIRQALGLTQGTSVSALQPGQFATPATYSLGSAGESADKLFDNNTGTKWCLSNNTPSPADPATHRTVVMRLADETPEITAYNLCTANDLPVRDPVTWTLEGSVDGIGWIVVDARTGVTPPAGRFLYYNNNVPFTLARRAAIGDTGEESHFTAPGSVVEVRGGATLAVNANARLDALRVDWQSAGTITTLIPAPNGVLTIVNAGGQKLTGLTLPLTIGSVQDRQNLRSWAVYVDGVLQKGLVLGVGPDGQLRLAPTGFLFTVQ